MTITLSQQVLHELFQESTQHQLSSKDDTQADVVMQQHPQLGAGYKHWIQLRDIQLLIKHYAPQDDTVIINRKPLVLECVEFGFRVSGNCSVRSTGQNFLHHGPWEARRVQAPKGEQLLQVDIHLNSLELFNSFIPDKLGSSPAVDHLFENAGELPYHQIGATTLAMQTALRQLLNCPYQGLTKQIYLESKCYELIALKLEQLAENSRKKSAKIPSSLKSEDVEQIHKAKDILIAHLDDPPSLLSLARQVAMNDHKLKRGFRQVFGTTVFGYLLQYRLEQARQLLATGDMSVAEVSHKVGFADRSYFTKAFSRKFGLPPGAYRRSQRGNLYTS